LTRPLRLLDVDEVLERRSMGSSLAAVVRRNRSDDHRSAEPILLTSPTADPVHQKRREDIVIAIRPL
jgi:hypothetical protein